VSKEMNLKELAEKLELSPSTISRVINDKPGISDKTRKLVLDAVNETGFTQNYNAQNLANQKARFIGIIGRKRGEQQDTHYFHHSMAMFEEYFQNRNYQCINLGITAEKVTNLQEILAGSPLGEKDFAGFIIRGQSFPAKVIINIKSTGLPIVLLENKLNETDIDTVVCEDRETTQKITQHFIDSHYKDIVHITGPATWFNNSERIQGYTQAMSDAGMKPKIFNLPDTTVETGSSALDQLALKKGAPLAVVAANDAMAIGLAKAARERNISIPEDLAITGFDNIPWAKLSYPPLTTAKVYIEEMGKLAAGRLLQLIEDPNCRPVTIRVPTDIIFRETT